MHSRTRRTGRTYSRATRNAACHASRRLARCSGGSRQRRRWRTYNDGDGDDDDDDGDDDDDDNDINHAGIHPIDASIRATHRNTWPGCTLL